MPRNTRQGVPVHGANAPFVTPVTPLPASHHTCFPLRPAKPVRSQPHAPPPQKCHLGAAAPPNDCSRHRPNKWTSIHSPHTPDFLGAVPALSLRAATTYCTAESYQYIGMLPLPAVSVSPNDSCVIVYPRERTKGGSITRIVVRARILILPAGYSTSTAGAILFSFVVRCVEPSSSSLLILCPLHATPYRFSTNTLPTSARRIHPIHYSMSAAKYIASSSPLPVHRSPTFSVGPSS